jgi:7,8-dihydropterin-6-yl-methyl-4-(beta-D-ribofuranosyl)aminobenzene 5'-phosphate synthase
MEMAAREQALDRRSVLCGGGSAMLATIIASLLGQSRPARAAPLTGTVPEVDGVSVRSVVDSYQIAVAPSERAANVDIERFGWALSNAPPSKALISEFGLSLHIESRRGAEVRNVLLDFGFTPEALLNNMELLGISAANLDALILSHGHYDHFGGLVGLLQQSKSKLRSKIPFYVGGEECFCWREWTAPPLAGNFGALDRRALETADVTVTFAEGAAVIADHAFTPGQIGLASFERVLSPTEMRIGLDQGVGCYPRAFTEEELKLGAVPDKFRHEIATVYNLKGRGLLVLTSCSHRGVVNAIKAAQAASGVQKVHAVIGGFHLVPYEENYVRETVLALKDIAPDYIIPMHCTGEPFYEIAKKEMPGKLLRAYTGTRFVFYP